MPTSSWIAVANLVASRVADMSVGWPRTSRRLSRFPDGLGGGVARNLTCTDRLQFPFDLHDELVRVLYLSFGVGRNLTCTDRLQFPFDLHDELVRPLDFSLLHDRVLGLPLPQYVVPADALRGRGRPPAPTVCVGLAALGPDRAVLHWGSVRIDADV